MKLRSYLQDEEETIIKHRRNLHQIPEPGFFEKKTSNYLARELEKLNLKVSQKIAGTGVTGLLDTGRLGPTLLIRSDMDGLPLQEETNLSFSSVHQGFMHGCGHDGHMAMVLGAASVLSKMPELMSGKILFLFQPAEEGPGGAKPMIEQGVLQEHNVEIALAGHLWPDLPLGTIGVKSGPLMAAMNSFKLTIIGETGHGAMPHNGVDALDTGVQVVNALQRLVSRQIDPLDPAVLTIGSFHSGSAFNVIPGRAELSGTTRTFNRNIWQSFEQRLKKVISGVCSSMGADFDLSFYTGQPPLINHPEICDIIRFCAKDTVDPEQVVEPAQTMCSEDMSFFLEQVKGCYVFFGVGENGSASLHNPKFDFDEKVLVKGAELYCRAALTMLAQ